MQRLQGWVRYAAQQLPAGGSSKAGQQQQQGEDDEADFIYGRLQVHSDDEEHDHHHTGGHQQQQQQQQRRVTALEAAGADLLDLGAAGADPNQHTQQQQHTQHQQEQPQQHLPGLKPMHQQHSYSETDLQGLKAQSAQTQEGPELIRLDSDDGQQQQEAGWDTDWATFDRPQQAAAAAGVAAAAAAAAHGGGSSGQGVSHHTGTSGHESAPADGAGSSGGRGSGDAPATSSSSAAAAVEPVFEAPTTTGVFDTGEEVPDHDHTHERRELIIYAIPLQSKKIIFLPVCPWRSDPETGPGWKKAVAGHVNKVQGEASSMWQKMAEAEKGSTIHRLYQFGKRLLESVPAEERLMRGVPKNVSKVVIHHPTQVSPEAIMEQMQTMTKNYGLKAVGRAAAATVMLPLAIGVDLIILPGPQVLTYYTMWQMYRNTDGAVGTTRMTKFITQGGSSTNIRVNYAAEPRLDRYHDLANDCPEGVLSEDDIEALVTDIREPDLLEALLSLRAKALRDGNVTRTSRSGDEYTALPPTDPAASPTAFGAAFGAADGTTARQASARF